VPSAVSLAFPRADQASMRSESSANNFGALGMDGRVDGPHGGGALNGGAPMIRFRSAAGGAHGHGAVFTCAKICCAFAAPMPVIVQRLQAPVP
jgi:hypothetical protein